MNADRRRICILITALLYGIGTASAAKAAVIDGPVVNPANGHSYYLLDQSSWQVAEAQAIALGGHLATINDAAEQNWVFSTFGTFGGIDRSLWIGLTDQAQEGTFVWTSGEPLTYTNWIPGQPDNFAGSENWVHMMKGNNGYVPGEWNDLNSPNVFFPGFEPIQGVVEVPEPSTLVLAALSACGLTVFLSRRRIVSSETAC
jgi:hypothetical protein